MLTRFENVVGKQSENEPLCRSRLDLILITAVDMEKRRFQTFYPAASASRFGQTRPLVLKFETNLNWEIDYHRERRTLSGRADYSLWYDADWKDLSSNLAVIEAKREYTLGEAKPQLLAYMGMQPFISTLTRKLGQ
jgi:hypothetical protein